MRYAHRSGGLLNVATTTSFWSTRRGRPERCRSSKAAIPPRSYRARHDTTVGRLTPTRSAISVLPNPSAANSTIRARRASPDFTAVDRTQLSSSGRSVSRTSSGRKSN